jgi:hypothetical protein
MVYTGRIFDIIHINEKVSQIVLRKKDKDKIVPVAITIMGYWKDKAFNELKLKPKDKIRGNLYLKSNLWKGKYYTDACFREVYLVEPAPIKMGENLFQTDDGLVDIESGELMEEIKTQNDGQS